MDVRLSDAELDVMNVLWKDGDSHAVDVAKKMREIKGWQKNTTYTLLTRLIKKGAVKRTDPGFLCRALVDRNTVCKQESRLILDKLFDRSLPLFARSFMEDHDLSKKELEELRRMIDEKLS